MFIWLRITEVSTLNSLKLQHICKKKRTTVLNKYLPGHDSSRRVDFDHVTTISESRLREQKSIKCNYSDCFRAFKFLYFDYTI